ncbi:MAG: glutathione S-transferase [Paracoccaceae bacterium]|jgi:glutathione S-transferase
MIELYHHSTSVCAAKVRIALAEKNLDWTGHFVDLLKGENFSEEYRRINPKAQVPTLIYDGRIITDSNIIIEFLEDTFPDKSLRPDDPVDRASMRHWMKLLDEGLHDAASVITYTATHRYSVLELSPADLAQFFEQTPDPVYRARKKAWILDGVDAPDVLGALQCYDRTLGRMEDALSSGPWLAGDAYSLADIGLTPYINRLRMLNFSGFWDGRPKVADWLGRIQARPSFAKAVMEHIPDALITQIGERGRESWPVFRDKLKAT